MAIQYLLVWYSAILLAGFVHSETCSSKYFCHTKRLKYRSFMSIENAFFNSSHVIRSLPIKEEKLCLGQCTTVEKCQSINHYHIGNASGMSCDLIDGNKWSNVSQLQSRKNSTHFYIQSSCASNPCRNRGTCLPRYEDGSYRCDCSNNNTFWKHGRHCENSTEAEMTADVYFNFDTAAPFKDLKGTPKHNMSISGPSKVLHVPDRSSPVIFMAPKSSSGSGRFTSPSRGSSCAVFPSECSNGASISFWFKISKESKDSSFSRMPCQRNYALVVSGVYSTNPKYGYLVEFSRCDAKAFKVEVRYGDSFYRLEWGSTKDKKFHSKWSHFMFTYKYEGGIVAYLNGKAVAKITTLSSKSGTAVPGTELSLNHSNIGFGMYLDDFAIWYLRLTAADVESIYQEGLKRNRPKSTK